MANKGTQSMEISRLTFYEVKLFKSCRISKRIYKCVIQLLLHNLEWRHRLKFHFNHLLLLLLLSRPILPRLSESSNKIIINNITQMTLDFF